MASKLETSSIVAVQKEEVKMEETANKSKIDKEVNTLISGNESNGAQRSIKPLKIKNISRYSKFTTTGLKGRLEGTRYKLSSSSVSPKKK